MPETFFQVRWPDGQELSCYSPSSVVAEFFSPDMEYGVEQFVAISEQALTQASERVKRKFGYYCSSAADQLKEIQRIAAHYEPNARVRVLRIYN